MLKIQKRFSPSETGGLEFVQVEFPYVDVIRRGRTPSRSGTHASSGQPRRSRLVLLGKEPLVEPVPAARRRTDVVEQ